MTLKQFNSAVNTYCEQMSGVDEFDRFVYTNKGQNFLYTRTTVKNPNFLLARKLGLTPTLDGVLFASVKGIPSEFEQKRFLLYPANIVKCNHTGIIQPDEIKGLKNTILCNETFIAFNITREYDEHEVDYIGFLSCKDGEWAGSGELTCIRYVEWLIHTNQILN